MDNQGIQWKGNRFCMLTRKICFPRCGIVPVVRVAGLAFNALARECGFVALVYDCYVLVMA
jgi:hypothetical protein